MTSDSERELSDVESNSELPEVISVEEHGPIRLAFYDERLEDCDGIEMPDPPS